jgi:hypothetical protein
VRARLAIFLAAAALLTSAVQVAHAASAVVATRRAAVLDAARTDRALIGADDLPAGWRPLKPETETGNGFCGSPDTRDRASGAGRSMHTASAFGADVRQGPFVSDDVYAFRSVNAAQSFVSTTRLAVSRCPAMTETYDNGVEVVTAFTVERSSPVDGVELGYAETLDTTKRGHVERTSRDVAYVRHGTVVSVVARSGHDRTAFRELERAAWRRMATAGRERSPATGSATAPGSSACTQVLDGLDPRPFDAAQDAVLIIRAGALAPLPAPPDATQQVTGIGRLDTVDMFLQATAVPDEITWRDRLTADGFSIAETIGYSGKVGDYGAEALRFTSTEQAVDFQRATLAAECKRGVATDVERLDGVPTAVTYAMDQRKLPARRSSTVIGPFVVRLVLYPCDCVADQAKSLLDDWTRFVSAQLGVAHGQ